MNKKITMILGVISVAIMSCGLYAPRGGGGFHGGEHAGGGGFRGGEHASGGFRAGGGGFRAGSFRPRVGPALAANTLAIGTVAAINTALLRGHPRYYYNRIPYYHHKNCWYTETGILVTDDNICSYLESTRRRKWR